MSSVHAWVPMWRSHHVCTHDLACSCSEGPARKRRGEHSGETVRNSLFCDPFFHWSCLNKVTLNKENKGLQRQALQRREFPDKECSTSSLLLQVKPNQFITTSCCRLLWSKKISPIQRVITCCNQLLYLFFRDFRAAATRAGAKSCASLKSVSAALFSWACFQNLLKTHPWL